MLDLQQVTKVYGGQPVVQAIDLVVPERKTVVIIGPSGSGKSTLLRIFNGLVLPDAGSVRFLGELLTEESALPLRRRMGYVIQDGGLFPHLTAGDNVTLMARQLHWPQARIAARITELTELTRLPSEALDRYPTQLSGGQRQRVALMRALLLDPALLLLDEPLGALDPMVRYDLQTDLKAVFRDFGKTVVLVTHDLGEAAYFADQVVLLNEGRIEHQGPIATLIEAPKSLFAGRFVQAQRALIERLAPVSP